MNACDFKTPTQAEERGIVRHWRPLFSALISCGVLALLPLSCSRGPQSPVLATVGDRKITLEDFRSEIERRRNNHRPIPDKETVLQEMVNYEALLQRAQKSGVANDSQVKRELNNLLIAQFQERDVAPRVQAVTVTDDEVRADYEQNLARHTRPAKVRLALLHLEASPQTSEAKRAELRARLTEARLKAVETEKRKNGETATSSDSRRANDTMGFGPLAIDYSDDQASRYRGGDIGWLDAGNFSYRWPQQVLETGYALEKGRLSELIETESGLFLVMKTDFREGAVTPLAQVQATIQQSLLAQKRRSVEAAHRLEIVRSANPKIDQAALASLKIALPPVASAKAQESGPPGFPRGAESPPGN